MKKSVLAKLKSKENFLTSYRESDELFDYLKQKQDEFDNGGIFVEICDNETMMNTDVNVSKIVACIRKYTIEGDVNKDLDVYLIFEVDILDTPRGRKLVNNDSSLFVLFDSVHKKFLIVDSDDYLSGEFTSTAKEDFRGFPFFIVGLLTKQKEVSDKITEEYTDDDLLKFLLRQIKAIGVDAKEFDTDEIVDATIIYKNRSETASRLPRNFIDYLLDRMNGLCPKQDGRTIDGKDSFLRIEKENNGLSDKCSDTNVNNCQCDMKEPDWKAKCVETEHENWILRRKVEALEYLIYNCIPKDDRRAG